MNTQSKSRQSKQTESPKRKSRPTPPGRLSPDGLLLQRAMADPASLSPADVLQLQRTVGNRATNTLLSPGSTGGPASVQAHRTGRPGAGYQGATTVVQRKLFQSYAGALKRHDKDRAAIHQAITEGLTQTQDRRLKNSCQWVMQGTPGKRIYAQTPTHDSFKRARAAGEEWGTIAVFPNFKKGGHMYTNGVLNPAQTYDKDKTKNDNVYFEDEGILSRTAGLQSSDGISIIRAASQGKVKIWETLRHEVQHAADLHKSSGSQADRWFEGFKTEFRAYSLEGSSFGRLSMTKRVKKRGYTWSERQYAVFSDIYSGYSHTKKGWDQNPQLSDGRSFRQAVVEFKLPYSVNPQNSIRVDKFLKMLGGIFPNNFELIEKFKLKEDSPSVVNLKQKMTDLMAAIDELEPVEKRVILSNPAIKLQEHLVDLISKKKEDVTELPPDYVPLVEETGEKEGDFVEFYLNGIGKVYWAKAAELEEYLTGHFSGRETKKLLAFVDPPESKIAYLYEDPMLSKAYTHVTQALRQDALAKLPPPQEIFG